jgi:hypothetical protein
LCIDQVVGLPLVLSPLAIDVPESSKKLNDESLFAMSMFNVLNCDDMCSLLSILHSDVMLETTPYTREELMKVTEEQLGASAA